MSSREVVIVGAVGAVSLAVIVVVLWRRRNGGRGAK